MITLTLLGIVIAIAIPVLIIVALCKVIGHFNRERDEHQREQNREYMMQFEDETDYQLRGCRIVNNATLTRALNINYCGICYFVKNAFTDSADVKKILKDFFEKSNGYGYHQIQWAFLDLDRTTKMFREVAKGGDR